ncbi:hypothetical protein QBC34DRAFT_398447 [Podospora aff. communis PSN243]|uniref:GST N-terminal domain-containing protein n=1 Tax=Podospora aff. communis PSN243 TaxID=3040156 RepID=A0AAV9GVF0_9PEZI|nr:hypothetical protein QBC34DRAFT_398447 [Podospora aff. communis PSN243]
MGRATLEVRNLKRHEIGNCTMSSAGPQPQGEHQHPVILYHYPFSPYARRVAWYLRLRGIPYLQCLQPPILPRPDIALLGLKHRRIPILSIGRDIYLDTRLILPKLEELIPPSTAHPPLSAPAATTDLALQHLLSLWTTSANGLFSHAQNLLPGADLPLLRDPAFRRDRADYNGPAATASSKEEAAARRVEAISAIRDAISFLETAVLADGREWILGTGKGPALADIEGVWVVHWVTGLKGALDESVISRARYPKVYAWVERFQKAVSEAKGRVGEPRTVNGEEARAVIASAEAPEEGTGVDGEEPVVKAYGLKEGALVEVWPVDSGSAHVDVGRLAGLNAREVVLDTAEGFRVHAPRHGFRVRPLKPAEPSL